MIALGERRIQGEYGSILGAGNLIITDSKIRSITCAGNILTNNGNIGKLNYAGNSELENTQVDYLKATGAVNFKGVCKGNVLSIRGWLSADYLECNILKNGFHRSSDKKPYKNSTWKGSIKAVTFESYYSMILNFDYDFQNIISFAPFVSEEEIACENFYGFDCVRAPEINAENIFLLTTQEVSIGQLAGSSVTIQSEFIPDKLYKSLPKTVSNKKMQGLKKIIAISSIEADQVNIEYTKANQVSGHDVVIGDLCIIDRVEYGHSIHISEKAVVNEIVKV